MLKYKPVAPWSPVILWYGKKTLVLSYDGAKNFNSVPNSQSLNL